MMDVDRMLESLSVKVLDCGGIRNYAIPTHQK